MVKYRESFEIDNAPIRVAGFLTWRFMYESTDTKKPLYSPPHLSLTMTGFPVNSLRKGFGLTGTNCAGLKQINE
jgi:hypothetical protein